MTVWKYEVFVPGPTTLMLPDGFQIVHFAQQVPREERLFLWALVDPDQPLGAHSFRITATGETFTDASYVATCLAGTYVWHLLWESA